MFITARGVKYGTGSPDFGRIVRNLRVRRAFEFIGVTDIQFIYANGLDLGDNRQKQRINEAQVEIERLAATW